MMTELSFLVNPPFKGGCEVAIARLEVLLKNTDVTWLSVFI